MKHLNERGMSVAELMVVMVVTAVMIGAIMQFTINYQRYGYLLQADQDTLNSRLNASDYIRENVGTSTGLITQNSIPDVSPRNPDPDNATGQYWQIIHAVPGSKSVSSGTLPIVYFKRMSFNASNAPILNGLQPYEDEYILYLDGSKKQLLIRTLANPGASGNRLKTSCTPPGTSSCPADRVIAEDIASVDMKYFSRTGNQIDHNSLVDPSTGNPIGPDFPVVDVLEMTVNLSKKPLFQKTNATNNSTVIRVALRNT